MRKDKERRHTNIRDMMDKIEKGGASYLKLPKGTKLFKPKEGVMLLDVVPITAGEGNPMAEEGMTHWERSFWVHRNIGPNNERVICPAMTLKEKCPICEYRQKLRRDSDGDDESDKEQKALKPSHRQIVNVVNRKDPDSGVQLLDMSFHLFGSEILEAVNSAEEDEDFDTFFLAEGGKTLKVRFGTDHYAGNSFTRAERVDMKDRDEDLDDDLLEQAFDLDSLLIIQDYADLKKMFMSGGAEDEDEDKPSKRKRSRDKDEDEEEEERPRGRKKDKDEEEEEEEPRRSRRDKDEEEEEEEPRGRRSRKDKDEEEEEEEPRKKKKPKKDDDWGDFDEEREDKKKKDKDEEEEEEEPRRGKRSRDKEEEEEEEPRSRRRKSKDDEEEEEEGKSKKDKDEEEEEEEPRRGKKKNRFARQKGDKGWDKDEEEEEEPRKKKRVKDEDDE